MRVARSWLCLPVCAAVACLLLATPSLARAQSRSAASPASASSTAAIHGVVLDAAGAPVVAEIRRDDATGPVIATSDAGGRFAIPADAAGARLVVTAAGFAAAILPGTMPASTASASSPTVRIVLQPAGVAEQVTVTAGRRELRGTDTPGATSTLTSAELMSSAALQPDDALRQTPGFTLFRRSSSRAANPTTQGVTLRGLSASGASRTLVLAGGVPLNDPFGGWVYWGRVPEAAIDRIEIVRGALSDLYGADAVGGVIHIVPLEATRNSVRGSVEGGSLGTSRVSLFGGAQRGPWFGNIAGERLSTDGAVIVAPDQRGPIDTPAGVTYHTLLLSAGARAPHDTTFEVRRCRPTTPTSISSRRAAAAMCWAARGRRAATPRSRRTIRRSRRCPPIARRNR
jgi:TonB-dependent Receptor Plug Domain